MSYDVYLESRLGSRSSHGRTYTKELFWINHTSNTAQMWREAGCDLAQYDGRKAHVLIDPLTKATDDIRARPQHYAQWNPPNGWGSIWTTLSFLERLLEACKDNRYATVRVDR